ncbi:MAG: hypothetical protein LBI04_10655 [Treponema sp.]|jgi:hypothetical protein|nr:hypothetical protein [Treponema sp.]
MIGRLNPIRHAVFSILLSCVIAANVFGQEEEKTGQAKNPFVFFLPAGYDYFHFESQSVHSFAAGAGFLSGEQNIHFTDVERRFFGVALYQPFFFKDKPQDGVPKNLHRIEALFDGRINRHQLLVIFKSAADKPVTGGLSTFQAGAGWGYEVVRQPHISLIIGAALGVSDFGITLPSGASLPVLPLPLVRLDIDTQWLVSSFDFLTGPNLSFTIAPKEKLRLTADMRMDKYRNINDLIYEYTLVFRLFDTRHKLGDFAGIGAGFKHDITDFFMSRDATLFELQQTSVFAAIDLSILKIQTGWIFDSGYLVDGKHRGSPGKGWYVSIQGMIPAFSGK